MSLINIQDNIPVLGEKSKECRKEEAQQSAKYEKPVNEERDTTDNNPESSYTEEGNLNGKDVGNTKKDYSVIGLIVITNTQQKN